MMDNSYPSSKRKYDDYLRLNETEEFHRNEQNIRKVFLNGMLSEQIYEHKSALVRSVEKLFGEIENYIVKNSATNTYIILIQGRLLHRQHLPTHVHVSSTIRCIGEALHH